MPITIAMIDKTILNIFGAELNCTIDEDVLVFGFIANEYKGQCCIQLYGPAGEDPAECVAVTIRFCDDNGEMYNFADKPIELLDRISNEIDVSLMWGATAVLQLPDNDTEIILYRTIRLYEEELTAELEGGGASELHWTLTHLYGEFEMVAPIVANHAATGKTLPSSIRHLLGTPASTC